MKALLQQLASDRFEEWHNATKSIRAALEADRGREDLSQADFALLLRAFTWFQGERPFVDLRAACEQALTILDEHRNKFGDEFQGLARFLVGYVENNALDVSGWNILASSPELAASLDVRKLSEKLQERQSPMPEILALNDLARQFKVLDGAKQDVAGCLRKIGDRFLQELGIIHTFDPRVQGVILHALNEFQGNAEVAQFFETFLEKTEDEDLRAEARQHLEKIR